MYQIFKKEQPTEEPNRHDWRVRFNPYEYSVVGGKLCFIVTICVLDFE
jgi:hypothetical protein